MDEPEIEPPPGHDDWRQAPIIEPSRFDEMNWPGLARATRVPLDLNVWDTMARKPLAEPVE